jgi:cysteinyl-tRNA synthetase
VGLLLSALAAAESLWRQSLLRKQRSLGCSRNNKEFAEADRARALLEEVGVAILDSDPLGWEWRITA